MDENTLARFWAKVEKTTGCWLWTGSLTRDGYGLFLLDDKTTRVNRLAWFIHHGEWPARGLNVLHKCDVRNCLNPEHLFLGTQKENAIDMASKCRGGHRRLTIEQVFEVRRRADGGEICRTIASDFGISRESVRDIAYRKKWRWLAEEVRNPPPGDAQAAGRAD